jgi:hypothetical protein
LEKLQVGPCPKCGGKSQFYHVAGDTNFGYCKCEVCGRKQAKMQDRHTAVSKWNGLPSTAPKRVWDNYEVITEVQKSNGIKFVVAAATRTGFRYINIREFYLRKKDGVWMPGKDGITIPLLMPLNKGETFIKPLADMYRAIAEASKVAATMELMDETKAIWAERKPYNSNKG